MTIDWDNQPHRVLSDEVSADLPVGDGQTLIEASDRADALKQMGECPACTAGLQQIEEYHRTRKVE